MAGDRKLTRTLAGAILALPFLAGCLTAAPDPAPRPTPTAVPASTQSPAPAPTQTPTPGPQPGGTILCTTWINNQPWLAEIPLNGSPPRVLAVSGREPVFNPAYPEMAYLAPTAQGFQIVLSDLSGRITARIPSPEGLENSPAFKPDGSGLAFARYQSDFSPSGLLVQRSWDILFYDLKSGRTLPLLDGPANESSPAWSADSTRLAYLSDTSGFSEVYLLDLQTNLVTRLTDDQRTKQDLVWSPDGQYLAFSSPSMEGQTEIRLISAEDGSAVTAFNFPEIDQQPAFSPDSAWIAFSSRQPDGWRIRLAHLDGRLDILLPARPQNCVEPAWRP